jgi:hypothetical protein
MIVKNIKENISLSHTRTLGIKGNWHVNHNPLDLNFSIPLWIMLGVPKGFLENSSRMTR